MPADSSSLINFLIEKFAPCELDLAAMATESGRLELARQRGERDIIAFLKLWRERTQKS